MSQSEVTQKSEHLRHTAINSGLFFCLWRLVWPAIQCLIRKRPGALGLQPPAKNNRPSPYGEPESAGKERFKEKKAWWDLYLWNSVRQILGQGRGEVALVSHLLIAIFVGICGFLLRLSIEPDNDTTVVSVAVVLLVLWFYLFGVATGYVLYVALRAQTPEDYARTALSGKPVSEIFRVLSYEMQIACEIFLQHSDALQDIHLRLLATGKINEVLLFGLIEESKVNHAALAKSGAPTVRTSELGRAIDEYQKAKAEFEEAILRLIALSDLAASSLAINRARLCEHIFDYDPRIHRELADQYEQFWDQIYVHAKTRLMIRKFDAADIERIENLLSRCSRIRIRFQSQSAGLDELFEYVELHRFVHRIASRHSTSGAIIEYAQALSNVASRHASAPGNVANALDRSECALLGKKLVFLQKRQRAYPGFDVHSSTMNLVHGTPPTEQIFAAVTSYLTDMCALLRRLREASATTTDLWNLNLDAAILHPQITRDIAVLRTMDDVIFTHINSWSRKRIEKTFLKDAGNWHQNAREGRVFILTHGYSKTVREVIVALIDKWPLGTKAKVLVMSTSDGVPLEASQTEQSMGDAQKMVYEMRERVKYSNSIEIAIGDEWVLRRLLKDGDCVRIVLGAEAYDERHVVHPRGALEKLRNLKDIRKGAPTLDVKVFVVSENYKKHSDLIAESDFFKYHLDRLDVYANSDIDYLVTEENVISRRRQPSGLAALIASRIHLLG